MSFRTLTLFQTPDGLDDDWLLTWARVVGEFKRRDGSPVTRRDLMMYNSIRLHFNGKHQQRILDVAAPSPMGILISESTAPTFKE